MSEKTTAKTATTGQAAGNEKAANIESAAGIIRTVQRVLRGTAESRDALPPGSTGSMSTMLCIAMDLMPCSERGALKTSLGDVAHILGAAFLEKTAVSPTIAAALSEIIEHATEKDKAACDGCSGSGRKYIATIQPPPDVAAAGIKAIEIWSEVPLSDEDLAARRVEAIDAARRGVEKNKELDSLMKETDSLTELVAKGGLKDGETRKQILQRLFALLHEVGGLKKDVDGLPGGKAPRVERVPDWRDTQRVPGGGVLRDATDSARTQGDATGSAEAMRGSVGTAEKFQGKPVGAKEDGASTAEAVSERKPDTTGHTPCAAPEPKKKKAPKGKPADGTAEISGYFTPEEAAALKARIREWLSKCNSGHCLGDLMTSIEDVFNLSDGQLGELVGISSRLVCNVRHGRPSPSAKARFTEVFGFGGVK